MIARLKDLAVLQYREFIEYVNKKNIYMEILQHSMTLL